MCTTTPGPILFYIYPEKRSGPSPTNRFSVLKNCCIYLLLILLFFFFCTSNQRYPYCFLPGRCLMLNPVWIICSKLIGRTVHNADNGQFFKQLLQVCLICKKQRIVSFKIKTNSLLYRLFIKLSYASTGSLFLMTTSTSSVVFSTILAICSDE